jgi:hypothetical protein
MTTVDGAPRGGWHRRRGGEEGPWGDGEGRNEGRRRRSHRHGWCSSLSGRALVFSVACLPRYPQRQGGTDSAPPDHQGRGRMVMVLAIMRSTP